MVLRWSSMTESDMNSTSLSWAALIGYWLDFARAAVCLPEDGEGAAWSSSVTPAITLQAVIFALEHLDDLDLEERALGLDRAAILVRDARQQLDDAWRSQGGTPDGVNELIAEAGRALARGETGPALEIIAGASPAPNDPPDAWVMPDWTEIVAALAEAGTPATLWLVPPGTWCVAGAPVGFIEAKDDARLPRMEEPGERDAWRAFYQHLNPVQMRRVAYPRQVYRRFDGEKIESDIALAVSDDPVAGQPMLRPALQAGAIVPPITRESASQRAASQAAAWPPGGPSFEDGTLGVTE